MKRAVVVLLACLFAVGLASTALAADVKMVLATGGTAGTYYPFGGAMAKIWNSKIAGMNVTAQATGASAENVRLVNKKEAELAIVQSDTIDFAYNAKEAFKEKLTKMAALAVLYPEVIQVVVRGDSKADSFDDLKGMKIGVGAPGSGTEANFRQLCDIYGLKKEDVKAQYLSFAESAEQFKDKHIDAFIVVAGIPNAAIMDIGAQHSVKIINVSDDKAKQLVKKYPFLSPFTIPANTYKGITKDVKTVAVNAVLIVNTEVKEDVAYNLVKALFDNQSELATAHAKGKELNVKKASTGVSIPFHPGAVKYYKEKGLL
ncbi:MAG: NMT1/THI5 like protein [Syntrophaceae bacterium PtaU1.Bin231]|nr:MAG: NMT1/THI5 like protein [Syntrophaceae bacterium PtaU1.Bin231]HOG18211.1 TAXI family TRAP transporter solute-binding subunit [Syntrophales bacterium]